MSKTTAADCGTASILRGIFFCRKLDISNTAIISITATTEISSDNRFLSVMAKF
jgi:hypothetical protein